MTQEYELALEIKEKIDELVGELGKDSINVLERVRGISSWIMLKNETPKVILMAMEIYLYGVIETLQRNKKGHE